jgi:hypothetical protein
LIRASAAFPNWRSRAFHRRNLDVVYDLIELREDGKVTAMRQLANTAKMAAWRRERRVKPA